MTLPVRSTHAGVIRNRRSTRGRRAFGTRSAARRLRVESLERRELLDGNFDGDPVPAAAPGDDLVPDMFAWASESRSYLHGSYIDATAQPGRKLLRFATAVANVGQGPMELRGGDILPNGNQEVYQRVFKEGGGFTDTLVGEFTYHETHQHIHFDGYAVYHLRQALVDDGVGDIVASGGKVSFCLLDVTRFDSSAPSGDYHTCGQTQGISVGWADIYTATLPDQWIDVTDVSDGEYWLEVVVDPDDRLRESDETNNVARVRVTLGSGGELGDRFESNDAVAQATDLGLVGDRVEGDLSIHAPANDDYFRLEMADAGTLDVTVSFLHAQGDVDVELLDENEAVVDSSESTNDVERITRGVAAGEVYYLRVLGYNGAVNLNYSLSIVGPDGTSGDRFEPNDDFATAADVGQLGDLVEGNLSIHTTDNNDYYRFSAVDTGTLDVSLDFVHAQGDLNMELFDDQFTSLLVADSTLDGEQFSMPVTAGTAYYLRVFGYQGATNASYSLSFDGPGGAAGDRFEGNDDPLSATKFSLLGDRVENNLSIHLPDNDDYFQFTAAGSGPLFVGVHFEHALGDVDVELLDVDLGIVAESNSSTDDEQLSTTVVAGATYFVRVFGRDGATNPNYRLSIDGPAPSGNVAGVIWDDRDNDSVQDASEPGLAGRLVYVDGNGNGQFDSAPPASEQFVAGDLPMPIDDHQTVLSTIAVAGVGRPIDDITLQLSLSHTYVGDLHVYLESPAGTRIELFSHVGGSGDDMTGTTLIDTAPLSIAQGNAPFAGSFRPLQPLSTFVGEDANGTWTLEIDDDEDGDEGSLLAWSVTVVSEGYFEPTAVTDAQGHYLITGLTAGTHTVAEELPPDWLMTFPVPAATHTVAVDVAQTTEDVDFGNFFEPSTRARVVDVRLKRSTDPAASYSIPVGGSAQLEPIPLVGIDQIVVVFERAWSVGPKSLRLSGVNNATYPTVDPQFTTAPGDGDTLVATWKLAAPLSADNLLAVVRASAVGMVSLDGEWTNPVGGETGSVFPSGDGQAGGDFRFRFNVLAGDANRDGQVSVADLSHLAENGFVDASHANYDARHDLDGNGVVNVVDAVHARNRLGASLPTGEPASSSPAAPSASAAEAVVARAVDRPRTILADHRAARSSGRNGTSVDARSTDRVIGHVAIADAIELRAARVRRSISMRR